MIDKFGARMTGTQSLENAIDHVVLEMKAAGLNNVHTEDALVPNWERGYENAEMILPRKQNIPILGLGTSVGTPSGGLVANVIVVETFYELDQLRADVVRGKIVIFAQPWESYGKTGLYRRHAASVASKKGAVAALVKSITPFSIGTLHAGSQHYTEGVRKIPVAAITVEDADTLLRMYRNGETISIRLEMRDRNLGMFMSRNTIAELSGEAARPVVVLSGHLDSWDVGQGAMDDGGGAFISWKALHLLKTLELKKPKRTLRAILFTAEEQGVHGARVYANQYKSTEQNEFSFFLESDSGTFDPVGLDFSGSDEAQCIFKEVLKLMVPLNATQFSTPIRSAPDIKPWTNRGFPGASLNNKNNRYFWFHHTSGDSLLLEDSESLDKNTALFAAAAYVIADLSIVMPKNVIPLK